MLYVANLLNVVVNSKGCIPPTILTGEVTDVSTYLDYQFWQEVFVEDPKDGEHLAHWCGPSPKQCDFLTCHVLLWDTEKLVQCSNICPAKDALFPNHNHLPPPADGNTTVVSSQLVIHSLDDHLDGSIHDPKFSPEELLGMTFVCNHDGCEFCVKVIWKVLDCDAQDHHTIKFLLALGDRELEEIISYNELYNLISEQHRAKINGHEELLGFHKISDHQGPLKHNDPCFKSSLGTF